MSGSPVYIDGRLVGAVSYSLGQFSKEPIAGITPIDEMIEATRTQPAPRRAGDASTLQMPLTPETCARRCAQAFSWMRPFAESPADVQVFGDRRSTPSIGTMLRPIATPLTHRRLRSRR